MDEIALHLLDLVENSINAGAEQIDVYLEQRGEWLILTVEDDGRGFTVETIETATDPFTTTRKERHVGLGLSLLLQSVQFSGGSMDFGNKNEGGSIVKARFNTREIDCIPMGDLTSTVSMLILTNPGVTTRFHFKTGNGEWEIGGDSRDLLEKKGFVAQIRYLQQKLSSKLNQLSLLTDKRGGIAPANTKRG